ncbi:Modification methylase DpnIIB [Symmachiella macrocystis]|uniref:Methyltransferase n=1 Tax=Symmachiella macrocystis TaxID=2527985 RepID=A0A5C6AV12_9PLAN|nr:DNA modification methylase [Symmachiella macrocystis]TWU03049.1 Modification methylase DpnIIB [Symmachiella macrocystis]
MRISQRKLTEIKPYQQNPRVNDGAVDAVAASLREYGFRQPVVVDEEGIIICGHTRWKAAQKLGLEKVPVHVAKDLSPEQIRGYRLADNQTATLAEWDADLLSLELADLQAMGFDLELTGFSEDELAKWSGGEVKEGLTDPDDVPEVPDEPITKPGDLWLLGSHRLFCGDSTSIEDTLRVMDGEKAALVATDPPYLVDYTGDRPNESGKDWSDTYREIDISDADAFFTQLFTCVLGVVAPKAAIYCWHAHKRCGVIQRTWDQLGILDNQQIIWVKPTPVFGRVYWHFRHEPCMLGWVRGSQPDHDGRHEVDSVWNVDWEGKARVVGNKHPTQKPVELFARPMRKHTRAGDVCFEPFSGSGSQILAAEQLGRRCFAMEIAPTFVDVAVERWEQFTGQKAERIPATKEVKA